jgi:pimeloyl-ACP methyl ester carboxylesterase
MMLSTEIIRYDDERELRVARLGTGPRVLVLLHGYPDSLQLWCRVAPLLAPQMSIVAIDWPGLGGSSESPGGATPTLMADRLARVLNALNIETCDLCGFDMGGQPALVFAAKYPQNIRRLVVMNSLVFGDSATSWEIALLRRFKFNRFFLRHAPQLVFWRAVRTSLSGARATYSDVLADFWNYFRSRRVREFLIRMCAGYQGQLRRLPEIYAEIQKPVLVLWSEHDKHFPVEQGRRLAQLISGSSFILLKDAPHWAPLCAPEEVAQAIGDFLR